MQENSFLPPEEPQEQHQSEGAQGEYCDEILIPQFLSYLLSNHREIWWASPILDYLQVQRDFSFQPPGRGSSRTTSR